MDKGASRAAVWTGLAAIYLIWGSTYLAIAVGVAGIPPFLMAALRFIPAGWALYAWSRWRGNPDPPLRAWLWSSLIGVLMLTFGNGLLSLAETRMPSGVAALLVAMVPLWLLLFHAGFERSIPRPRALLAVAVGLAGVAVLSGEGAGWKGGLEPLYVLLVMAGSMAWAFGSLLSRRPLGIPLAQSIALQMLGGGTVLLVVALARGEPQAWDAAATGLRAWAAVLYLSLFGSIIALTTYVWLLKVSPPGLVGTYAFVNPVVAVLLGALLLGEPLTGRTLAAGLCIVAAVALSVLENTRAPRAGAALSAPAAPDGK